MRINGLFGIIGLIAVILGFLSKTIYRDYINLNKINDYGVAGSLPSYFYVVGFTLLLLIKPNKYPKVLVLIVTLGSVLYELMQWSSTRKLDVKDILAAIAGGLTVLVILKLVKKKHEYK
ncbi:hypothetical protein [uncultured Eudoraea sp.]|uniref:hypothetical protein n=1 Tax=uncultured Eudoraea sp. TaxID=1035614 RepID=UPI00260209C5|nr:hypothetical protein [uncultured Eudoraea sp.]